MNRSTRQIIGMLTFMVMLFLTIYSTFVVLYPHSVYFGFVFGVIALICYSVRLMHNDGCGFAFTSTGFLMGFLGSRIFRYATVTASATTSSIARWLIDPIACSLAVVLAFYAAFGEEDNTINM